MSAEPLNEALLSAASPWGAPVQVLEETSSSNDELLRMGEEGASAGSLIFTERQTAGRGQFQRPWASAPGLGLWFSLLLRLEINDGSIPSLSAFAAVAIVQTAGALGIADCGIKAPNDVLIAGRKAAGILIETRMGKSPTSFAVVGIGLNVNHSLPDFPPELQDRATSLALASGALRDRNMVATLLLTHLGENERLMRENPQALHARWNELLIPTLVTA
ncbi:MAG: biotin--[acetyl-CoA-carboxylase] ligase [Verrucomicrobia bacterium]|nr:biotin--[acetyl-CoA-carboxylase] ligase [Verrucomicrobiota bacterium]